MANDLSVFIPERWASGVVRKFRQRNLAMAVLANDEYQGDIGRAGDTVHVRTVGTVEVRPYSRGTTVEYQDLAPTEETLVVDQSFYEAIAVDDLDAVQNDVDALAAYTTEMGVSIAEHMDAFAFGFHASANSSNKISNSGSAIDVQATAAGATHVYDLFVQAGQKLDDQNVPTEGRWAIVSPYIKALLLRDTVYFIKGSNLGDNILTTARFRTGEGTMGMSASMAANLGFIGQIGEFDVYVSNALANDGAGNRYILYGQGRPLSMVVSLNKMEAVRLERTFGTGVRYLTLYGGKVFNEASKALGRIYVDNS